jgi:hypothetical protein
MVVGLAGFAFLWQRCGDSHPSNYVQSTTQVSRGQQPWLRDKLCLRPNAQPLSLYP